MSAASDSPTENTTVAAAPETRPDSPAELDFLDDDDDLEHLPKEKRIQLALAAIQGKVLSERKAATYYRIPRVTLQDRRNGAVTREQAHAHERKLTSAQEDVLVEWIKSLGRRGIPLSLTTLGSYAAKIWGAPLGVTWPTRFKKRHPDLKVKWTTSLEECRARNLNRPIVHEYFTLLSDTIEQYEIKFKNIWNMDEKGIQLGVGEKIRVLVDRDQKNVHKIETGKRDLVTIIECISADGTALHPSVVFEGKRRDLRWGENNPSNASISISPNGWTDQELGAMWLEKDFAPASAERLDDPGDYRLLILDGHNSHCTWRFIDFAQKHRIVILCLPSHTTHALQPCDVGVFGPLSIRWKARVSQQHSQNVLIDKYNLLSNYAVARDLAFQKQTIINAFRRCGIWPLDESAVPAENFEPALNYTTQAAMPLPVRLPSLLAPIPAVPGSSTSATTSTTSTSTSASTDQSGSLRALSQPSAVASRVSTSTLTNLSNSVRVSFPSSATSTSVPSQACPSTPNNSASARPSTPTESAAAHAIQTREAVRAAYAIAMPSPVRKTASRRALAAENDQLRDLLQAAGVELERNHAHMILMEHENAHVRQQLHAKKNKPKRTYTTGQARLMTSTEMREALLKDLQKKQMAQLHAELRKQHFPRLRSAVAKQDKAEKAAQKAVLKAIKAVFEAAYKAALKATKPVRGRGRGRGRGESRGIQAGVRRRGARGRGRGRGAASDTSDEDAESPESEPSPDETDHDAPADSADSSSSASDGPESLDEEPEINDPDASEEQAPGTETTPIETQDDSDDDDAASDEEETGILSFNGHRWESRRNLQFQVVWTDGDVTWEPLSNVNDCAAMEGYLADRDVDDPLLLSKRKFLINARLKASNE